MSLKPDFSYLHLLLDQPVYLIREPEPVKPVLPPIEKIVEKTDHTAVTLAPVAKEIPATPPVQLQPIPVPVPPAEKPARQGLKVLILFNNQQSPYLKPSEEALLIKILQSVGLHLDEVDLVNLNNIKRIDYVEVLKEKELNQLISFGIVLKELQIHIPLIAYEVKNVEGISILLADGLAELEINTDKKKMLWKALKQMFER